MAMKQYFLHLFLFVSFAALTMCSTKREHKLRQQTPLTDSLKKIKETSKDSVFTAELLRDSFLLDDLLNFESEEALIKAFGKSAITRAEEFSSEVEGSWWVTVLFQGTKNEVRFLWNDGYQFEIPNKIYHWANANYKHVSDWRTKEGIRLGTTMSHLEKLNEGPFNFYGFSWNFEGQVVWNNPQRHAKGVYVSLRVPEENWVQGLDGTKEISSDSDIARQAQPVVAYIEMRRVSDNQ